MFGMEQTITGFSISVDALGSASTLGGDWESFSMGSITLEGRDAAAGGYFENRYKMLENYRYDDVTLTRCYSPDTAAAIEAWFSYAEDYGPTTIAITVHAVDAMGIPVAPPDVWNFKDAYPTTWNLPTLKAGEVGNINESISFTHSGFYKSSDTSGSGPGFTQGEKVEECRLVIIPGAGASAGLANALSSLTSWTGLKEFGGGGTTVNTISSDKADAINSSTSAFPSISFFLPPSTMTIFKSGGYQVDRMPSAQSSGPTQWLGTDPMQLSFEFLLNQASSDLNQLSSNGSGQGNQNGTVLPIVEQLMALCEVDSLAAGLFGIGTAPMVILIWGNFVSPLSYVQNLNVRFTRFDKTGAPIRAEGSITLQAYPVSQTAQNPTSGGEVPRAAVTHIDGESLAHNAFREYRSAARWRDLAEANDIDDPMRIPAGRRILVPAAAELPARGESGKEVRRGDGRKRGAVRAIRGGRT